jgi:DNA-binding PucR family transcriptional regulator
MSSMFTLGSLRQGLIDLERKFAELSKRVAELERRAEKSGASIETTSDRVSAVSMVMPSSETVGLAKAEPNGFDGVVVICGICGAGTKRIDRHRRKAHLGATTREEWEALQFRQKLEREIEELNDENTRLKIKKGLLPPARESRSKSTRTSAKGSGVRRLPGSQIPDRSGEYGKFANKPNTPFWNRK